jgi:preprotein translocase subunit YajC
MLSQVARGDRIVTNGGLVGTVTKVLNDAEIQVEIADGVRVHVMRGMISSIITKSDAKSDAAAS